jgi:hypothetical protein
MSGTSGILRRFKDAGIAEFVRRIETLRAGGQAEIDDTLLTDPSLTEPIVPEVPMERPAFKTKRDAGAYLSERTRAARGMFGDDDRGLWTWLSAWHWDAVCPVRDDGRRKVLAPYNYVFGHLFEKRKTQHLIAVAARLYERSPDSRLLLDTPIYSLTSLVEQVSTRLAMTRIGGFFALLDLLYFDSHTGKAKQGVVDASVVRPGDLRHRLPARIRQLEVTHDLTNLTAEQLLNLLGDEFRQWAVVPTASANRRRRSSSSAPPASP